MLNPPFPHYMPSEAQMQAEAAALARDKAMLLAMPPEAFEREMRMREVKALERTSFKRCSTTIYNSSTLF